MISTEWETACAAYRPPADAALAAERLAATAIGVEQFEQLLERPHLIDDVALSAIDRSIVMSELAEHARFHAHILGVMRTQSISAAIEESTVTAVAEQLGRTRQAVSKEYRRYNPAVIDSWSDTVARALEAGEPHSSSLFGGKI